jgi:hypothetical protein
MITAGGQPVPLRDHFRSPVNDRHTWDELHGGWPMMIVQSLYPILPAGYTAAPGVHLGKTFEIDVSAYELDEVPESSPTTGTGAGGAATRSTPKPTLTLETELAEQDEFEVRVYDVERGRQLVAAIELVSPSDKDRPEKRAASVGKVAALLQKDVCVSIVDLVTIRQFNLYVELLALIGATDPHLGPTPPDLYSVTIRSRKRPRKRPVLDMWFYPMTLGQPLPILPIWLNPDLNVLLPLEPSYEETCRLLHIS